MNKEKLPISVCIIGLNEEKKIEECLKSVANIAEEIIYVDSYSSDKTVDIVKKYSEKIFYKKFSGFVEQKNYAIEKASNDWILSLDCDERFTPELEEIIREIWANGENENQYVAFRFRRLTYYIYKFIRHSGWYPDKKIRLFNRKYAKWTGLYLHETVEVKSGRIKDIEKDILHYSFDSISDHLKTIDSYSTIGAQELFEKGRKAGIATIIGRTVATGFKKFFLELSFLDGRAGIILTGLSMAANWAKYSKLYILNRKHKI